MKRIKRIIAFALMTVMMMAMSLTAFAAQANSTIKVTNLVDGAVVRAYKIAEVNYSTNDLDFVDWVKDASGKVTAIDLTKNGQMSAADVAKVTKAFQAVESTLTPAATATASNKVATLSVPAGYYYVKANATDVTYNSMVVVAYDVDANGNYKETSVEQIAKGEPNEVFKEVTSYEDGFVDAGEEVSFKLRTTIPENVVEYKFYDEPTNLTEFTNIKVTVGGQDVTVPMTHDAATTTAPERYTWDFSSIVADHYGEEIIITYDSTVIGSTGYLNQVYDSTPGSEKKEVHGYTAEVTLTKTDKDGNAIKSNPATFQITRTVTTQNGSEEQDVYFVKKADGLYEISVNATDADRTRDVVTNNDGQVKLTGLDEGVYHFTETVAPQGYSINTAIEDLTITKADLTSANDKDNRVISYTKSVTDSDLIKLPFTGGMGTTIFTVLGVAIMAMAAALYFATKKNNVK